MSNLGLAVNTQGECCVSDCSLTHPDLRFDVEEVEALLTLPPSSGNEWDDGIVVPITCLYAHLSSCVSRQVLQGCLWFLNLHNPLCCI